MAEQPRIQQILGQSVAVIQSDCLDGAGPLQNNPVQYQDAAQSDRLFLAAECVVGQEQQHDRQFAQEGFAVRRVNGKESPSLA